MVGSTPTLRGFKQSDEELIRAHLNEHRFFWIDLPIHEAGAALDFLQVAHHASRRLLNAGTSEPPSRKFHSDQEHVVFPFPYVRRPTAALADGPAATDAGEAGVLVHGDYLVTVHEAGFWLGDALSFDPYGHRSERYIVYAVLDGMLWTVFEALDQIGTEMGEMEDELAEGTGRPGERRRTVGAAQLRLSNLRRLLAPQRGIFERVSAEVGLVKGLEGNPDIPNQPTDYFERVGSQLGRAVDDIDAAARDLGSLIDLSISETNYRLSIVATIFLPITALTGFFGMNFLWLTDRIESVVVFWLLGFGVPALSVAVAAWLIARGEGGLPTIRPERTEPG